MTQEQLTKIAPNLKLDINAVNELLEKYEINTPERIACFFAQCSHESGGFKAKIENLNYSAEALNRVFPAYFGTKRNAAEYARNPEKIANVVYNDANRKSKLGNTEPGDGWKFRGRGYIQLTGRTNYTGFSKFMGMGIDEVISYAETDEGALASALYFWKLANCNKHCDSGDQKALCKSINGGFNGLEDRIAKYNKFIDILL